MSRPRPALLALTTLALVTACSPSPATPGNSEPTSTRPAKPSASTPATSGPPVSASAAPTTIPPLGKDLACFDSKHCFLKNPDKSTDAQIIEDFHGAPGADRAPAATMKPWAYVVLGLGEGRITGMAAPRTDATPVTDDIGILNHRAVFAFCQQAASGSAISPTTPRKDVWLRIEPLTTNAPAQVWINGEHLYAYGHNGRIPTC